MRHDDEVTAGGDARGQGGHDEWAPDGLCSGGWCDSLAEGGTSAVPKKVVQSAPATDTDGELAATAEPEVFGYYNLDYGRPERRLARR